MDDVLTKKTSFVKRDASRIKKRKREKNSGFSLRASAHCCVLLGGGWATKHWLALAFGFRKGEKEEAFFGTDYALPTNVQEQGHPTKPFLRERRCWACPRHNNAIQFLFWWYVGAASKDCARSLFLLFRPRMTTLGFAHFYAGGFAGKGKKKRGRKKGPSEK